MITRLLAANDASFASLPPTPTFDFDAAVADAAIPSALPLPVSNPLPQLRAFSALTFTKSLVTPLPPGLNRQHQIVGYAGAPIAALTFQVSLVVSAHEETVEELYCSVSQWARGELTPVIKECAGARDPKVLLWAISTYQPLALKRAKVWARLCWRYPGLLPQYAPGSKRISKKAKAKAKAHKPSPREINALLGERVLCFRPRSAGKGDKGKRSLEFVVRWSIGVDEVGEAVSTVDGDARVPGVWTQIDADGNLARVAPLFKDLVAERGVFEAVKCMVGLLFPHEEPRE
ncbi:hypothetical protein BZA05DRAFT_404132 [Tricharina praecox]|uniref:uncharacterized protein n=1 Tax=Tricharina praecox TaxID=43433 RepID=UPI00221F5E36|nr:uncharacterized protein BZA05DRAFT_404132 [Tricharina praecox]KAI5848016.1 hypothetical protein BZA05DRAFT_404132 [Tricharina praecox]